MNSTQLHRSRGERVRAPRAGALPVQLFSGLLFLSSAVFAGPPKSFRITSYKDFSEGQAQGVMLSSLGEALSGLSSTRIALPSLSDDSVRALAAAPDGAVYVGTGGDGPTVHIYEKEKLRKLAKLDGRTWVSALCIVPGPRGDGELLAATAQDGRIFQVSRDGKVKVLATVTGDHVWALVPDPKRERVYAATGPGRLFSINPRDGKVVKLFDSGARQLLALTLADDGQLYLGTADDAVLYRLDPDRAGSARALHDFAGNELRALVAHKGVLYAAVNDMQRGEAAPGKTGVRLTPPLPGTAGSPAGKAPAGDKGKGALYRIEADGRVEQVHSVADSFFNALHVDGAGNVYAAASTPGGRGRLYCLRPDRTVLTALEIKESDLLVLSFGRERLIGTGNSGALYRLSDGPPRDASYTSKVLDGGAVARFGSLRYAARGTLRIETRSGNLAKPDGTWAPWQGLLRPERASPMLELSGKVASPPGRYLQVRALFLDRTAEIEDFMLTYQALNLRARLLEIQIGEDPIGRLARGPKITDKKPRQPVVKLKWKAENPDEDELCYRLYVRPIQMAGAQKGSGDEGWLRLSGPDPILRTEFDWNTETVADGAYEARVVVTDERQNPPEQALSAELVSPPFIVDNRRPEIRDVSHNATTGAVSGRAVDATSPLGELSYAIDGGDFLPMAPRDGVLDDPAEEFALRLPYLPPGAHTLLLRAADAAENAVVVQLVVYGSGAPALGRGTKNR